MLHWRTYGMLQAINKVGKDTVTLQIMEVGGSYQILALATTNKAIKSGAAAVLDSHAHELLDEAKTFDEALARCEAYLANYRKKADCACGPIGVKRRKSPGFRARPSRR
jgi:hypothetical protein